LGNCAPVPFCGPTHTPLHIGNGKINVWEYYGSQIWAYYYDSNQNGLVTLNLGSGIYDADKDGDAARDTDNDANSDHYLGCASDPTPSSRPGGATFCLAPAPAAPGSTEVLAGGVQVGGYPYSVGQIEGIPLS
jgi:hypothetical protein